MAACVELGRDPIYDPSKNEGFHYGAPLADIMAACDVHDWQTALLLDYVVANNAHRPTKRVARSARAARRRAAASAGTSSARRTADLSIVACTQGWLDKCGYEAGDILHRNCRFLQGPLTCFETIGAHPHGRGGIAYYISVHDPPDDLIAKARSVNTVDADADA
ncbi:hypothetical protein SO694_000372131 [Aureococcus anophagefferens]|uniref:Uncharacterized protein n=1 Tax=Aureococcus anophagefferens TaxID=44056 RepID=A0ABR1FL55_AURAN